LATLGEGEIFGEEEVFEKGNRISTVICVSEKGGSLLVMNVNVQKLSHKNI
jgi:CRP-like cAMP-binding protein